METLGNLFLCLGAVAVVFYLSAVAWIFFFQERLIYVPSRTLWRTPTDAGLPHEEVFLTTSDQVHLHGWFIRAPGNLGTVLFFHGNAGNISHRIETAQMFHRWGLNVFMIDYRGYGNSGGKPSESGTHRDAETAWGFLVNHKKIAPEKIVIHGRSLGSAVTADLAARVKPAGVILESGFTALADIGATLYPWLPVRFLNRHQYPTIENVRKFRSPVLVAHSRDDDLIPFAHGEKVFAAALEPKSFLPMVGTHGSCSSATGERYERALKTFIYEVLLIPPSE